MTLSILCKSFLAGGLALSSCAIYADEIEWNFNNLGVLAGNGCNTQTGDTFLIPAGSEFSIIFTRMTLELDQGSDRTKTLNCRGRIPVRVRGNAVVEKVEQELSYSYAKTKGSRGNVFARNTWFGRQLAYIDKKYGPELEDADAQERVRTSTTFGWACSPSTWVTGFLGADFGLAAQRDKPASEAISMNIVGQDFKYRALVYARPGC